MSGFKVAVVGPSGSGKSTAARCITATNPAVDWIEASRDLIERREYGGQLDFLSGRDRGLEYFRAAVRAEGKKWAANRLLKYVHARKNVIATGIRGVDNVRALRDANFFCVYLYCAKDTAIQRLMRRENIPEETAQYHLASEEEAFQFNAMRKECHFSINTDKMSIAELEGAIVNVCITVSQKTAVAGPTSICLNCANPHLNSALFSGDNKLCNICINYLKNGAAPDDASMLSEILGDLSKVGGAKALLGVSGGKDSTASALYLKNISTRLALFTVDMGYYPLPMLDRAKDLASRLGLSHTLVDGRQFITPKIRQAYEETAALFERLKSDHHVPEFRRAYLDSRAHYSAKDTTPIPHPRVCVLCRKSVIRAYYDLARRSDAKYVFLGINEWASLSSTANAGCQAGYFSGIRKIEPYKNEAPVYIIHLPFITGATLMKNSQLLISENWEVPFGEEFVETNGNSCLLAKSTENSFHKATGFHPDSTRLSREVTVGFLRRVDALHALSQVSVVPWNAKHVIQYAGIIGST